MSKSLKKPLPPQHPSVLGAQRFFARLRTFDLECPHCGMVYRVRDPFKSPYWSPRTGRFTCNRTGGCGKVYVLGILAWPPGRGGGAGTPPPDQLPVHRQLLELRAEAAAYWMPDEYRHKGRPEPTNLTGEPERPEPEDEIDLLDTK